MECCRCHTVMEVVAHARGKGFEVISVPAKTLDALARATCHLASGPFAALADVGGTDSDSDWSSV